jgi:tripartite-type tricarboxylate transporter receptor subunit TctC
MSSTRRCLLTALGATCVWPWLATAARAAALDWPTRAVNFIVPFPPGGPVDTTARLVAKPMGVRWSQATIIDNRAGAGGIVGAQLAARMPANGYNFFFAAIHHAILPSLRGHLSYDIERDFDPVGMAALFPIVLMVSPKVPARTVQELIAYARANPDKLSYGSSGTGGGTHLAGALFCSLAKVEMQHVPYRGSAPAMQDLLGGQVQLMFADGPTAMPHLHDGTLRALGVGNPEPSALFPALPTIASAGVPGYQAYSWTGIVAPKGTPPAIIERLNADLDKALTDPATRKALLAAGAEPRPDKPAKFGAFIHSEIAKWGDVIRSAHITVDASGA